MTLKYTIRLTTLLLLTIIDYSPSFSVCNTVILYIYRYQLDCSGRVMEVEVEKEVEEEVEVQ